MPGLGESIIIYGLIVPSVVLWIWMFFDCLRYENSGGKAVWLIVIVLAGVIGALVYLIVRRRPRRRTTT